MIIEIIDEELYSNELANGGFGPRYAGDAGIDLRSRFPVMVHAGTVVKVPLGVKIQVPDTCVGWVSGRSSTATELGMFCHEGKIDSGYRGEIHACLTSTGAPVPVRRGDRIAQLVVVRIELPQAWSIGTVEQSTDRGDRGFGSSGKA